MKDMNLVFMILMHGTGKNGYQVSMYRKQSGCRSVVQFPKGIPSVITNFLLTSSEYDDKHL